MTKTKPSKKEFTSYYLEHTIKSTASYFGVSRGTIGNWIAEYNCYKFLPSINTTKIKMPNKEDFIEQYFKKTYKELSEYYLVSDSTIQNWVRRFNLKKPLKIMDKDAIKEYYKIHSLFDTAIYFGISKSYLTKLITKWDFKKTEEQIADSHKRASQKLTKLMPSREKFEEIFFSNMNKKDISKYFNVSPGTIDNWRIKLKVGEKPIIWYHIYDYEITDIQKQIIIGSMLGDGCIRKNNGDKQLSFMESHCIAQKDYLIWKYEQLKPLSTNLWEGQSNGISVNFLTGKLEKDIKKPNNFSIKMQTITHPFFTNMEKEWYKRDEQGDYIYNNTGNRIKIVPENLKLSPLSIAIWFLDDGCNSNSNAIFCTNGFSFEECERLIKILNEYDIKSTINSQKGKPIIRISSRYYLKFIQMIEKYIPVDCMKYKIDLSKYNFNKKDVGVKLNKENVLEIIEKIKIGITDDELALKFSVKKECIQSIRLGYRWKEITKGICISNKKTNKN